MTEEKVIPKNVKPNDTSVNPVPGADVNHFCNSVGSLYIEGDEYDNVVDPYVALSWIPPGTAEKLKDMSGVRSNHPLWIPEDCTGCGDCLTVCGDTAILGLVNTIDDIVYTSIRRLRESNHSVVLLNKVAKSLIKNYKAMTRKKSAGVDFDKFFKMSIGVTIEDWPDEAQREDVESSLLLLEDDIGGFKFALTKKYHDNKNEEQQGEGGLFSIKINPRTCKDCDACIEACPEDALLKVVQTDNSLKTLRKDWGYRESLPTTDKKYYNKDNFLDGKEPLKNMLLDKSIQASILRGGDGACAGCGEKQILKLYASTITAIKEPLVKKHVVYLADLIERLQDRIDNVHLSKMPHLDSCDIHKLLEGSKSGELTVSELSKSSHDSVDISWLENVTRLLEGVEKM